MEQTTDVQELSLEKVIDTKLVQSNVTEQVLAALKEKYAGMTLKALDDKESYLELKLAAKDCAKVRNLTTKVCKEGRERAVKEQKLWIAKEKEIIGQVSEIEDPLDAEIAKYDAEVERKATEEKNRQEEAYINRQATLTKMGATYTDGSFVLGDASFEAVLIKESSQDVWEEAIVPKFETEYQKKEAARIAEETKKAEQEAEMKRQQEELQRQQAELKAQQEEMQRKQQEAANAEQKRVSELLASRGTILRGLGMSYDGTQFDFADIIVHKNTITTLSENEWTTLVSETTVKIKEWKDAEAKRKEEVKKAEIEKAQQEAVAKEQERQAEQAKQAEILRQQEETRKQAELEAASDKNKWDEFIRQLSEVATFEMRSGQYRKKMQIAKEKIEEIQKL